MVLHLGGAAPSRPEALDTAHRLLDSMEPEFRDRLVLEHLDGPADLMLEAKEKDLALFDLRRSAREEHPNDRLSPS